MAYVLAGEQTINKQINNNMSDGDNTEENKQGKEGYGEQRKE